MLRSCCEILSAVWGSPGWATKPKRVHPRRSVRGTLVRFKVGQGGEPTLAGRGSKLRRDGLPKVSAPALSMVNLWGVERVPYQRLATWYSHYDGCHLNS